MSVGLSVRHAAQSANPMNSTGSGAVPGQSRVRAQPRDGDSCKPVTLRAPLLRRGAQLQTPW